MAGQLLAPHHTALQTGVQSGARLVNPSKRLLLQCPPIDKCTQATDFSTNPPCCCTKCTAPYQPSNCKCTCPSSEPLLVWPGVMLRRSSSLCLCFGQDMLL